MLASLPVSASVASPRLVLALFPVLVLAAAELRLGGEHQQKVRIVRTRPEAPGHFWGEQSFFLPSNGIVVLSENLELHLPTDAYIQVWSPKYKSEQTTSAIICHHPKAKYFVAR